MITDPKEQAIKAIDKIIAELKAHRKLIMAVEPGSSEATIKLAAAGLSANYDARLRGIAVIMMQGK